jgi:hypothetical protein
MIMVGELFIACCEKSIGGTLRAFELWGYPDTSLNLVLVSESKDGKHEACFPCAAHQLQALIDGRRIVLNNGEQTLELTRRDEFISAEVSLGWRQCIEADTLQDALDRIQLAYGKWIR